MSNHKQLVCTTNYSDQKKSCASHIVLLPRLPQDLLAGCKPLHVHDWVDFMLGLLFAALLEEALPGSISGRSGFFDTNSCDCDDCLEPNIKWVTNDFSMKHLFLVMKIVACLFLSSPYYCISSFYYPVFFESETLFSTLRITVLEAAQHQQREAGGTSMAGRTNCRWWRSHIA